MPQQQQCDVLIRNGCVLTMDAARTILPDGAIAINGHSIAAVGVTGRFWTVGAPTIRSTPRARWFIRATSMRTCTSTRRPAAASSAATRAADRPPGRTTPTGRQPSPPRMKTPPPVSPASRCCDTGSRPSSNRAARSSRTRWRRRRRRSASAVHSPNPISGTRPRSWMPSRALQARRCSRACRPTAIAASSCSAASCSATATRTASCTVTSRSMAKARRRMSFIAPPRRWPTATT